MASKRRLFKLNPTVRRVLSIIAVVYIATCIVLFFNQRSLLYFSTAEIDHGYPTLIINNEGEQLKVIALNEGKQNALLYFGGNNEAVAKRAEEHLNDFPNHTIYLINYRGYGGSTGEPTEHALYADALAVFDELQLKHKRLSVMGRSLGTGVATYVAITRFIQRLILVTPYDSIEEIAKEQYPFFPIGLLIKDTFNSYERAPLIKADTLIIVAGNDQLIPTRNTLRLVKEFRPEILKVKAFKGVGHSNVSHLDEYHAVLKSFMSY